MSLSQTGAEAPPVPCLLPPGDPGHWPAGAVISQAAMPQQVVRGVVLVRRQVEGRRPVVLEILGAGAVLGAEAAGSTSQAATALQLRPLAPAAAMAGLLHRIAALQDRALITCHGSAEQRLAWLLVRMAGADQGGVVSLPLGRAEMAGYLGLTPETLSRGLASLRQRGLLGQPARDVLEILRPEALAALCRTPSRQRREPQLCRPMARRGAAGRA